MPRTLTWLHLSDLHACSRDNWDSKRVTDTLIADLRRVEKEHSLCPDFIFFTGDAAWGNDPTAKAPFGDQFIIAHNFFEKVRTAFSREVPQRRLYIVPGNHDIDRDEVTPPLAAYLPTANLEDLTRAFRDSKKELQSYMARLVAFGNFLKSKGYRDPDDPETRHFFADVANHRHDKETDDQIVRIGIAGFNSAWTCGKAKEDGELRLCGHFQNEHLHHQIEGTQIRIALIHHPLNWIQPDERGDVSAALTRDYHFLLHGHEHDAWVKTNILPGEPEHHHHAISSAACYDRSNLPNGYNLVQLDLATGKGRVFLRKYDSRAGAWGACVVPTLAPDGEWPITCPRIEPTIPATPPNERPAKTADAEKTKPNTDAPANMGAGAKYEASLRGAIRAKNNFLDLPGITITTEEAKSYDLSVAYVSLSLAASKGGEAQPSRRAEDLLDTLPPKTPRLLISGPAGCGKTTLIRWIAVQAAQETRTAEQAILEDQHLFASRLTGAVASRKSKVPNQAEIDAIMRNTVGSQSVRDSFSLSRQWRHKLPTDPFPHSRNSPSISPPISPILRQTSSATSAQTAAP